VKLHDLGGSLLNRFTGDVNNRPLWVLAVESSAPLNLTFNLVAISVFGVIR
jgi:hypothetical protein